MIKSSKFITFLITSIVALGFTGCETTNTTPEIPRLIDTHIHFYDTGREAGVDWPPSSDKVLFRPVLPEHYDAISDANGIDVAVIVEASGRVEDNQWILDLVAHNPKRYAGVVGSLPIGTDAFPALLERFSADPRYKGIRMRARPDGKEYFNNEKVWRDLALLERKGLTLDILLANFTLGDVAMIAKRLPKLKILINHVTGLPITGGAAESFWIDAVKQAAAYPNVHCKVSGIFERTGKSPAPKELSFYAPVFKVVYEAFGEDRIIYGSNWPVSDKGGRYEEQFGIIDAFFTPKGDRVVKKLYGENAARFYGL